MRTGGKGPDPAATAISCLASLWEDSDRPVLGIWHDGAFVTTSSLASQKARTVGLDQRCARTTTSADIDIVVEGKADRVTDGQVLRAVAEAYQFKYGWPVSVEGAALLARYGAPAAGVPPYAVFGVVPETVFAFGTAASTAPRSTRWQF